jgi:hypothetical protein
VCFVSIESLDRRLVYWMLVSLPKIISISFTGRLYAKHRFHVITAFFPAFMTVRPILAASTQVIWSPDIFVFQVICMVSSVVVFDSSALTDSRAM